LSHSGFGCTYRVLSKSAVWWSMERKMAPGARYLIALVLALTAGSAKAQSLLRCEHGGDHEVISLSIADNNTAELRDAFGRRYRGFFTVSPATAEGILKITNGAQAMVLLDRVSGSASITWSRNSSISKRDRTYSCAPAEKVF
jgi:hypothetical protein